MQELKNIDTIISTPYQELVQINEVGEKMAESIRSYFTDNNHIEIISKLKDFGLQFSEKQSNKIIVSNLLEGMNILVTGNFSVSRDEIKGLIEANSGKAVSSLSSKTTYMIAGDKSGPSKMQKAEKLGVKVISEEDFYKMININI